MTDIPEAGNDKAKLVPCTNCGRTFLDDRIETHKNICTNHKTREVYDITMKRVIGTEAGELFKAGKLKLEPPKPMEKKSALQAKLNNDLNKSVLPPIVRKQSAKAVSRAASAAAAAKKKDSRALAYSVTFDGNDQIKTKKNSKFKAPLTMNAPPIKSDKRFLSPESAAKARWHSAADRVTSRRVRRAPTGGAAVAGGNSLSSHEDETFEYDENEEEDFLAASWASQKTVCSDAFDFLFDSANMNPDNVKKKLMEHQISTDTNIMKDVPNGLGGGGEQGGKATSAASSGEGQDGLVPIANTSACCAIS